ncbi:MAG: ATP-binding protein [Bacteroides sp.]
MRYLNRIIFINSATIRYAEVRLDGNVHFIGTQGVGKSTILRSILFFYNADTQKLGIPVEKKGYAEYYFPFADSYIIYEVVRETGNFCVLSFKSVNRICYRFIDCAYSQELFIDADGAAYDAVEKIRASLDRHKVNYSTIINTYEEYRNILYGNELGKRDLRKYALMESKQFQNIPRTIQNVLLNSKLEAEFIKQTIISSLNEEEAGIDLTRYKVHLANFETQLKDIEAYQRPEMAKLAEAIAQLCVEMDFAERKMADNSKELFVAHEKTVKESPLLQLQLQETEESRSALLKQKESANGKSQQKRTKIESELAICKSDLLKAKKKEDEYALLNIGQLIARAGKQLELKARKRSLQEEQKILTSHYQEVSTRYDALIRTVENQLTGFLNEKEKQKLELENEFNTQREEVRAAYLEQTEQIRALKEQQQNYLQEARNKIQEEIRELEFRKRQWKSEQLYSQEMTALQSLILTRQTDMQKLSNDAAYSRQCIESLTRQWEAEKQGKEQSTLLSRQKLKEKADTLQKEAERIGLYIENSKNSFYGWLNDHVQEWEESIGKVCDESVLYQSNLAPQRTTDSNFSFFGVTIDLNQIDKQAKTTEDYLEEKQQLEKQMADCIAQMTSLTDALEMDNDKLKKKYQPQIKEHKEKIRQWNYELEQAQRNRKSDELQLADWKKKALMEQEERLTLLRQQTDECNLRLNAATDELQTFNARKEKELAVRKAEMEKRIKLLVRDKESKQQTLATEAEIQRQMVNKQKTAYEQEKQTRLKEQGADTDRLQTLSGQLAELVAELDFIDKSRDTITDYKKDKRELLDKVPEMKTRRKQLEERLEQENERFEHELKTLNAKLAKIYEQIRAIEEAIRTNRENCIVYENVSSLEWYAQARPYLTAEACTRVKTTQTCKTLNDEITRTFLNLLRKTTQLRKEINEFTGNFSTNNIFAFRTQFTDDRDYRHFANELRDFIEEHRIEEFVRRVNDRHSDIFRQISSDTTDLTSREGAIQTVVKKINDDFVARNFVGIIQRIEMRVDDSSNKIVQILRRIKKFNDENSHDLGGVNLFSSGNEDQVKARAVSLLRELIREMTAYRKEFITLSDSFELKFRVEENQNDTGFVERLSNVGSEGTDILVKAMINIMLLNVFKEGASRKFKDFKLHCVMDEIGKLHPSNIMGILKFANDRNILLINGSPTEQIALAYKHIYKLEKDAKSFTQIKRILSQN